jgi:chromosome segregation ATPase
LQEKIIIRLKSEIQQLREELLKNLSNKEEIVKIIAEKEVKIKELESEIDNYYKSLNPERLSDEIKKTKRELESLKNDKDAKNSELKSELEKKLQKLEKTKSINVDSNCLNKPKNKELPIRLIVG